MRRTLPWPVFIRKHSDDDIFEVGRIERAPAINVVFDGIEFGQSRVSVSRYCRFTGCCRMHIGTGERGIEKARGREGRPDAALACQGEVLEARNPAIYGDV